MTPKQVSFLIELFRSPRLLFKSSDDTSNVTVDPMVQDYSVAVSPKLGVGLVLFGTA